MSGDLFLAGRFEAERPGLRAVAYRMPGSLAEAEDAVQEAWFKLSRTDVSEVRNLGAGLTTVVGRTCPIRDGRVTRLDILTDPGRLAGLGLAP